MERDPNTACDAGLVEVLGCSGNCLCAGILGASAITSCRSVTACGGEGQRACCVTEPGPACGPGLVKVPICSGNCLCADGIFSSSDTCTKASACGGKGLRACCALERPLAPCDSGLIEIPGCSGDCSCPALGDRSSGMCSVMESIAEPDPGQTSVETATCSMRGYADIHLHLFGDLAHGGGVLAGAAYDPAGGINGALQNDFGTYADLVDNRGASPPLTNAIPYLCPSFLPGCGPALWHGNHDVFADSAGAGTKDGSPSNLGAPLFNGWPRWTSTTHQQAYYKWLERAWRGGLRLTVMLAVQNEAMCRLSNHRRDVDCADSMAGIDLQLAEARRFETFIDGQAGGAGLGWFRIVGTPAEARRAIRAGKLAVVLGIEVDNLFGCKKDGTCTTQSVTDGLARYRAMGVRHIFPIHNFDNAFGGTATWQDAINVGNAAGEQAWWETENCAPEGYGFWLDTVGETALAALATLLKGVVFPGPPPAYPSGLGGGQASCNSRGLTPLGQTLVSALMQNRMIIDIDHMSRRSVADTFALAAPQAYPLVASHVQAFDLHQATFSGNAGRHERMRTGAQLASLRAGGGLMGAMLKDDVQDTDLKGQRWTVPYGPIADDCRHSSKSFAQAYQYAVDQMGGAVPFGSDFNGIAGHLGPRFGSDACGGAVAERQAQVVAGDRLDYPFSLPGFGTFDRQVTGQKTFDFNVDGLAHVGLLPDLVADLTRLGLPAPYLDSIYRSAEAYVELWERVEGTGGGETRARCVDRVVPADATCHASASVASGPLQGDPTVVLVQSPPGPYGLGATVVTLTATSLDACEPPITCTGTVTVRDVTPPTLTCPPPMVVECAGPLTPVTFAGAVGADNCGAVTIDGCSSASGTGLPPGPAAVTCTGHDGSGHTGSCAFEVQVRDTTPPVITLVRARPARLEAEGHELRSVTVSVAARDACDAAAPACRIVTVTSSQPPRRPDRPDWVITGPLTVDLRAEITHPRHRGEDHPGDSDAGQDRSRRSSRAGHQDLDDHQDQDDHQDHDDQEGPDPDRRIYTLGVECADQARNTSLGSTTVTVVRD
jgi:microsomal dipeptidase-like Zn-dependent dipeptidase